MIIKVSAVLCQGLDRKARDCSCIVCTHLRVNTGPGGRDKEIVFNSIAIRSFQDRVRTF